MTMEHKAFVFDYDTFMKELAGTLEYALRSYDNKELIAFIENNLPYLKDPYEGEPLEPSWKEMIEIGDLSEYGDFALTKYYDPNCDMGIGYDWNKLDDALISELKPDISPLLGLSFGLPENYFDPGKLGSYFQPLERVKANVELINSLPLEKQKNLPNLVQLKNILSDALNLEKGLYITF